HKRMEQEGAQLLIGEQTARLEADAAQAALGESLSDGFVALSKDWRYTYVNQRAACLGGGPRTSLGGISGRSFRKVSGSLSSGLREGYGRADLHSDGELL